MLPTPTFGPGTSAIPMFRSEQNQFFCPQYQKPKHDRQTQVQLGPSRRTTDPYVTGSSVLAVIYKDGVMIAADTLASYGSLARFRSVERMKSVGKHTLIGASGEYSDFQYIMTLLDDLIDKDNAHEDGSHLRSSEIYSYMTRVLYNRRNRFDPLWNQLVLAGFQEGKPFLGQVDSLGSSFEDSTIATGYGAYIARPLLRKAVEGKKEISEGEAKALLEECMRVLYYRDARTINRLQIAKVTAEGVSISDPYELETEWLYNEIALGYPMESSS